MELELVDITGYEGLYQINRAGQVWGATQKHFLKSYIDKLGYSFVVLSKGNKLKTFKVHRLLALQFLPNPLGLPEVDHIDITRTNNSLDNLRWVSHRANSLNRTNKSKSGEHNILVTYCNTFLVYIYLNKKRHSKTFNTMDEAKIYRDNFFRENNLF